MVLCGGLMALGCGGPPGSQDLESSPAALEAASATAADPAAVGTASSATVSTGSCLGKFSPVAVGLNSAAWDGDLVDPALPGLLKPTAAQALRYPGGSTSDNYHWLSNGPDDPAQGGTAPDSTFDAFMSVVSATGAQAMITVNYGSGTAQEAADWVAYANRGGHHYTGAVPTYPGGSARGHKYGIRYWEVGNELYGDGTYGATWEVNHKPHDPTTYAQGVVSYSAAMKAVDPSIRVGAVLTAPGNWPDGQTSATSPLPWNDTVLGIACSAIDFVAIHWYPQGPTGESDAALLASPEQGESTSVSYTPSIPSMVATVRALLTQYCGAHADAVQIMVTETNSVSYNPGKQTTSLVDALYLADAMMTWFENGVSNVDWWAIHNSPFDGNLDPALYGDYAFGDYGILSVGQTTSGGVAEPPLNTPFPAYFGVRMLSYLGHDAEDSMLQTTSSNPLVAVHAVRHGDGTIGIMLINKDPAVRYQVTVSLADGTAHGWADVHRYGPDTTAITATRARVRGSSFTIAAEPYSLTTVTLP